MKFKTIISILFIFILVLSFFPNRRSNIFDSLSAIYGSVLVSLTNKDRVSQNISELKINSLLEIAAQMKADDMAKNSYFSHNSPDGKTPWYWVSLAGYQYKYAGENLAVNFTDSEEVHTAWRNSRGHFLNIINPKYTEIGIATSTGHYKGREVVFVVQMFGTPK